MLRKVYISCKRMCLCTVSDSNRLLHSKMITPNFIQTKEFHSNPRIKKKCELKQKTIETNFYYQSSRFSINECKAARSLIDIIY